jgi:hypothetical protein
MLGLAAYKNVQKNVRFAKMALDPRWVQEFLDPISA